ncbi:hypothetical protein [Achromobacter spanius]|uniref:hypothetical protein n=1 Tax=Achromobacter spanius TaxID=217203 RepID=UPI000A564EC1|nr:hypothetical protein [Achromobacter spanius]
MRHPRHASPGLAGFLRAVALATGLACSSASYAQAAGGPAGPAGQGGLPPAGTPAPKGPAPDSGAPAPSRGDPSGPPPTIPQAAPGDKPSQPVQGQGTVKGSSANPAPDGRIPGGKAGSGGHKTNEFGR